MTLIKSMAQSNIFAGRGTPSTCSSQQRRAMRRSYTKRSRRPPESAHARETSSAARGFKVKYCTVLVYRYPKSQPRTGHTREPDPTHNELKHTTTRKTATHSPQTNLTHPRQTSRSHAQSHTHTSRTEHDANQQTTPPRITATLTQPPPRASALARGTIACASSTDPSASASARKPAASPAAAPAAPAQPRQAGGG